jgi:hypothetical protein
MTVYRNCTKVIEILAGSFHWNFHKKKVLILDVDPGAKLENATNCTGHLGHQ